MAAAPAPIRPQPIRYHWLKLRATCHPTEDPAKVEKAVASVSGLEEAEFRKGLTQTPIESHHGGHLIVLECTIDRSRAVRDVLQRVFDLPGARDMLMTTADARTDDDGVFYARFDKQDALAGKLVLTQGEDAVQMRLKLEVYPSNRDAALEALRRLLAMDRP